MQRFRVWQVSDTHLSASHAYFYDNWQVFLDEVEAERPDLVVHSGDLTFNAPDVSDDLRFGRAQLDRLTVPWLAIPGNHDVGEPGEPRLDQPVTPARLAAWDAALGPDHFCQALGDWLLVGINCEVLGSGLDAETEQWQFLESALAARGQRPVLLFLHKPLFLDSPDEQLRGSMCVLPAVRERLLALLGPGGVRQVSSGHLHAYGERQVGEVGCVWCPTTAFIDPLRARPTNAVRRAGFVEWLLEGETISHRFVQPGLFGNLDITNWTHHRGTSINLPPRPLRGGG